MPRYLVLALMVGMTLVLAVCGGVSDEEFEAAQQELSTEKAMVADLKAQIAEAEAIPAPLAVVEANITALNAGDVRGLVATYADDTVFSFGPLPGGEFDTNTGLAKVLESDLGSIGHNQQITLSNTSVEGDTVRGAFSLTNDGHRFRGPDSLPAGWTTLRLSNESKEPHHMQLIQLPEGMTMDDLFAAFAQPGPPPPGLKFSGGAVALFPGGSGLATVNLAPGNYVMACFIPDENGAPHAAGGMVKPLTVTAATGPAAAEPQAVATVEVSESGFTLSGKIPAGVQTVKVTNIGQAHPMRLSSPRWHLERPGALS